MKSFWVALGLMGLLVGCSADGGEGAAGAAGSDNPFGNAGAGATGDTPGSVGDFGLGSGDSSGLGLGGGTAGSGSGTGVNRDAPDATGPCKRVDVVMAVDGSSSMTQELQAMRDTVFPAFAQRLPEVGDGVKDFRVGVIDACPMPSNLHTRGNVGECNYAGGRKWIENVSPNFAAEVTCVGDLFQGDQQCSGNNDDEQPANAIAQALESSATGQVNAGFLRGDALLVVMAITDEDEQPTAGARDARDVYNRLVDVVDGDPRRIVFIGVGGESDCVGPYGDAREANVLKELTGMFSAQDRGVFHNLCQGRIEDSLNDAFDVIEKACEELPPPYDPPATPIPPCGVDECLGGVPPPTPILTDAGSPD
jgi:hypothetical protein